MVGCLVPSLDAVGSDILAINLETIKIYNFKYTLLAFINSMEDSILQHLLTDISSFVTVFFRVFYDPLINLLPFCAS
jgi:hypothetical protein